MRSLVGADLGDTRLLVWASRETVRRVDCDSGVPVEDRIRVNADGGIAIVGDLIVAAGSLGLLSRWDLRTGDPVGEPLADVAAVALRDGSGLIVATTTCATRLRDDRLGARRQ
jgi:hypothetical protein